MGYRSVIVVVVIVVALTACFAATASADPTAASVGESLFFDTNLSNPIGQSCATCHAPAAGYADPRSELPVSTGAVSDRFGNRNAPSAAYLKDVPARTLQRALGTYVGGLFWDGRADSLEAQAKGPFLNPLEMHMARKQVVVARVADSAYADDFRAVFGADSLTRSNRNVDAAYDSIAFAIAEYERSDALNPFTSKHDLAMSRFGPARMQTFTMQERQGMMLFNNMGMMGGKANCSTCHVDADGPGLTAALGGRRRGTVHRSPLRQPRRAQELGEPLPRPAAGVQSRGSGLGRPRARRGPARRRGLQQRLRRHVPHAEPAQRRPHGAVRPQRLLQDAQGGRALLQHPGRARRRMEG